MVQFYYIFSFPISWCLLGLIISQLLEKFAYLIYSTRPHKTITKEIVFFGLFSSWMNCSIINASAFWFLDLKVCRCVMLKINKKNRWQDLKDQISYISIWNLGMASLFLSNSFILSWILWWRILCTIVQYKYLRVILKYDSVIK